MSEREFEDYLRRLTEQMGRALPEDGPIRDELRDHLESRLAELAEAGVPHEEAVTRALDEFGDESRVAAGFTQLARRRQRRRWLRWSSSASLVLSLGILILWAMWPEQARVPIGPQVIAQSDAPAAKSDKDETKSSDSLSDLDREILARLDKALNINVDNIPMSEVLEFLEKETQQTFDFDEQGAADAGVAPDTPVTLNAKGIRLRSALNRITSSVDLAWMVRDGVIEVTSRDRCEAHLITITYDIRDLFESRKAEGKVSRVYSGGPFSGPTKPVAPVITLVQFGGGGASSLGGGGLGSGAMSGGAMPGGGFGGGGLGSTSRRVADVVGAITSCIAPDSWRDAGGNGMAQVLEGTLVVSQTWQVHDEIRGFLQEIRQLVAQVQKADPKHPLPVSWPTPSAAEQALRKALQTPTELQVSQMPLQEVLASLEKSCNVTLTLDTHALESDGIVADSLVTVRLKNVSLETALRRLSRKLQLAHLIADDTLWITTQDQESQRQSLRIYPIADFGTGDNEEAEERFLQLITTSVESPSWADEGGAGHAMVLAGTGIMVVRQTNSVHQKIETLLADLRTAAKRGGLAKPAGSERVLKAYHIDEKDGIDIKELITLLESFADEPGLGLAGAEMRHISSRLVVRATPGQHARLKRFLAQQLMIRAVDRTEMGVSVGGGGGGGMF